MPIYRPFTARNTESRGTHVVNGTTLKTYAIACAGRACDASDFADVLPLVDAAVPSPDVDAGRPGVGFLILHAGNGVDYTVLAWWDRENELPIRVFVRERTSAWRAARGGESVCVWDLDVIARERDAYVATMLAGGEVGDAREAYLRVDVAHHAAPPQPPG